jgi:hypothetical protein
MFYKALGYAVWKLSVRYARRRYGHLVKPGAGAAVATAVALIAVYVATRGDE